MQFASVDWEKVLYVTGGLLSAAVPAAVALYNLRAKHRKEMAEVTATEYGIDDKRLTAEGRRKRQEIDWAVQQARKLYHDLEERVAKLAASDEAKNARIIELTQSEAQCKERLRKALHRIAQLSQTAGVVFAYDPDLDDG